jgi:nucleotide-binding universal stress UspA family protein
MATGSDRPPVEAADRPLVLVDVRPTSCAYQALVWALREVERRDADLLAVTIWSGDPSQPDERIPEMEQVLATMVERAVEETGVRGRTRVAVITSPVTVHDVARSTGAELLVVGAEEQGS